jgi:tripartite-type tricarboxylate transporter receptor subunit TctC
MSIKKFLLALLLVPVLAHAWEPTRPVTVIIGFQPGSGNEVGFRVLAKQVQLANPTVNFIIELKPGADSVLATNALAESRPDGHTITVPSYMGTYVTNDIWQRDLKKWQYNSITNVMGMGKSPMAIVANSSSKIHTPQELNALLRDTTRPITFAVGAGAHRMTWEFIMDRAHGNRDLVKYAQHQGPLQAVTAVASDSGMEFGIMPVAIAKPLLDAGRVKLIGISGDRRVAGLDAEPYRVGGQYINVFAAWSLALPPGTTADIVDWYQRQFSAAIKTQEVQQFYRDNYIFVEPAELTPQGLNRHIEHLRSIWMPMGDRIIQAEKKQ